MNIFKETAPSNTSQERSRSEKVMIGTAAIISTLFILNGCADKINEESNAVDFPKPSSAPYFLDSSDPYYNNLRDTMKLTQDQDALRTIENLLDTPVAAWLNGDNEQTSRLIKENIEQSSETNSIPIFAVYNIPQRDLGGEAKGGLSDSEEYKAWIDLVSAEIGDAPSVIILEPDALAGIPEMNEEQQRERIAILHDALGTFFYANPQTAVYLDAGNSKWHDSANVAELINRVDPDGQLVGGIALNVANQLPKNEIVSYAESIVDELGRPLRLMIDASMTGSVVTDTGLASSWCNTDGEHVGSTDNWYDAEAFVEEAFIKTPGESDGNCGTSQKPAGEFDPELLIRQVS